MLPSSRCNDFRPTGRCVQPVSLNPAVGRRRRQRGKIRQSGFSLIELVAVAGILVILAGIFLPYLLSVRESSHRTACADNLRQIRNALQAYARDNEQNFPRVRHDEANPHGYTAYSGADDANPFADDSAVLANDVTASLWLLVRGELITDPKVFICPSTSDAPDKLTDLNHRPTPPTRRGNFRSPAQLSYSYASPFTAALGFRLNSDWLKPEVALIADKSPGNQGGEGVTSPRFDAPARQLSVANSRNHKQAGQNVLFADGHVSFHATPYCGVEQDNIYTALWPRPLERGHSPPANGQGYVGPDVGAAWNGDSYLVPTEEDDLPPPLTGEPPSTSPQEPASAPAGGPD